jgi:inorganic pyrophosphatase
MVSGGGLTSSRLADKAAGPDPPRIVYAVIETPKGSKNKYEYSKEMDALILDRVLHSSVVYPLAYGFVPGTLYEDGDPLDIMVLMSEPVDPGCVVRAKPVGMLRMLDSGRPDDKILASVVGDPRVQEMTSYEDIPRHELLEIAEFFQYYKRLEEGRVTEVKGWAGRDEAFEAIEQSVRRFEKSRQGDSASE